VRQTTPRLVLYGLAWFLIVLGALGIALSLSTIFFWESPDGEWTQADATGTGLICVFMTMFVTIFPAIAILFLLKQTRDIE
jgi:hypothetical protein